MIHLTENAVKRIHEVIEREHLEGGLRLAVQGGGCSGLTYAVKFDSRVRPRDQVFEFDGVKVFVDPKSLEYLKGMTLDYKVELLEQRFVFQNPNAKQSCSCGVSFTT